MLKAEKFLKDFAAFGGQGEKKPRKISIIKSRIILLRLSGEVYRLGHQC